MSKNKEIITSDLRDNLKSIMLKEINNLPKHIETLEPKERIDILIKLMPFVFPKVTSINMFSGEPMNFEL